MAHKKKKRKKKQLPAYNKKTLRKLILEIFRKNPQKPFNYKQLAKRLEIKDDATRKLINSVLKQLRNEEKLEEIYTGKFKFKTKGAYITGIVDMTRHGAAYIITEDMDDDIYISPTNLNHALHGDEVKVYVWARKKKHRVEGEVVEILKKSRSTFVGTVEISKHFAFLIPEGKNMLHDLFIPLNKLNGAKEGDKAIAEVIEWPKDAKNPIGEIVEVLGPTGDNDAEMHAILAEFDLPHKYPERIIAEAEKILDEITEDEIKKRKDFRDIITFTIDPEDAKDFDDALSIRELPNGNYEIGVHIADVSHYVKPNTLLDEEAYNRATSVYLVDRVVPMLPERLSNLICSLRPDEEKLTFSAVFEMNNKAHVIHKWFGKTIIKSNRRFTYDEAQQIIETGKGDLAKEVLKLNELAQKLRAERYKRGSISFDKIEVKFHIDENGKPLDIYFKQSKEANKLIEEFMLLANKKVAEEIGKVKSKNEAKTFVYRVHDEPDLEKLNTFSNFIKRYGYKISLKNRKEIANSINELLDEVQGKAEQNVIENLAIRSMAKAEYSVDNIGHYGLAFDYYTHFTSPIRRYPDLMVHRLLEHYLHGGKSAVKAEYEQKCKHSSDMEQRAAQAERASIKYKQVEFMQERVGDVFEGVISGITEWGMYVELVENKVEGMVALRDMDDDFYIFNEKEYSIIGEKYGKKFTIGDTVKVQIVRANLRKKQLDYILVDGDE